MLVSGGEYFAYDTKRRQSLMPTFFSFFFCVFDLCELYIYFKHSFTFYLCMYFVFFLSLLSERVLI